jgi:hypothetical protein
MKRIARDPELKKMDCGKDIPVGGPALVNLPKTRLCRHINLGRIDYIADVSFSRVRIPSERFRSIQFQTRSSSSGGHIRRKTS